SPVNSTAANIPIPKTVTDDLLRDMTPPLCRARTLGSDAFRPDDAVSDGSRGASSATMRRHRGGASWRTSCAILRTVGDQMPPKEPPSGTRPQRRGSWKGMPSHLGRGIRTVQRWERDEGLPVHRLGHIKRGTVYADCAEITARWERRSRTAA